MTLYEGMVNTEYIMAGVHVEEAITRRLEALGFNDGTKVLIVNQKKNGSMIVKIRGTRLALGKHITSKIEVTQEEQHAKRD